MKTRSCVLACVVALVGMIVGAGLAQATTMYSYDFTSLGNGNLVGQDGWSAINNWGSLTVTNGTGAANTSGDNQGGAKPMSLPTLSSTDTLVETARFYNITANDTVAGLVDGNQSAANWLPGVGIANNGSDGYARAYFRDVISGTFGEHYGDALTPGDTYDMRLTVNLSAAGGLATVAYRDVTLGQTDFTTDASGHLANVPMGLHQDGSGNYAFNALALRIAPYGTGISQFTVTTSVPEPSVLGLLVTGMLGLLAYAWRKRK
jgi:hypothetical protein